MVKVESLEERTQFPELWWVDPTERGYFVGKDAPC
jgi:hypothetical protein